MSVARRPDRADNADKCDQCDKNPSVRCPGCHAEHRTVYRDPGMQRLLAEDRELGDLVLRNARAAKSLAACSPDHPAYAEIDAEYIEAGMALAALRARRRHAARP